jgi:hypothetical protein
MAMRGSLAVLSSLFLAALLCSCSHAKDASEKPAKKKGDMTAYQKRIAAKFIAETAKKEGVSKAVKQCWVQFFLRCSLLRHFRAAIRDAC